MKLLKCTNCRAEFRGAGCPSCGGIGSPVLHEEQVRAQRCRLIVMGTFTGFLTWMALVNVASLDLRKRATQATDWFRGQSGGYSSLLHWQAVKSGMEGRDLSGYVGVPQQRLESLVQEGINREAQQPVSRKTDVRNLDVKSALGVRPDSQP